MPPFVPKFLWPLRQNASTTDRAQVSAAASSVVADLDPFTIIALVQPHNLAGGTPILGKGEASDNTRHLFFRTQGTTGQVATTMDRVTTDLTYITSATPLVIGKWVWLAMVFNSAGGATTLARFYAANYGTANEAFARLAMTTTTDGSGAFLSDSTKTLNIGNSSQVDSSFAGFMAYVTVAAADLTDAELNGVKNAPLAPCRGRRGLWLPGTDGGLMVRDLSGYGQHALITGGVPSSLKLPMLGGLPC